MATATTPVAQAQGDLHLNPSLTDHETVGVNPAASTTGEPDLSLAGLVASGHASPDELAALSPDEAKVAETIAKPAKKGAKKADPAPAAKVEAATPVVAAAAVADPAAVVEAVAEVVEAAGKTVNYKIRSRRKPAL